MREEAHRTRGASRKKYRHPLTRYPQTHHLNTENTHTQHPGGQEGDTTTPPLGGVGHTIATRAHHSGCGHEEKHVTQLVSRDGAIDSVFLLMTTLAASIESREFC
jgi:hypothetical protein